MALTEHYFTKFAENNFYHIYNRSVDRKPMFKNERNFEYFLKQYDTYLSPVLDTYSFSLLNDHFHLLVRIREHLRKKQFEALSKKNSIAAQENNLTTHDIVSNLLRQFFQSYAMAFNIEHNRIGTLFQTPFKRALIEKEQYLPELVHYIHTNPQLHGLTENFRNWKWSSYNMILNDKPSKLKKKEVLEWFGNKEDYKRFHSDMKQIQICRKYTIEDEILLN